MARWMVLYADDNGEPKQAIVNDHSDIRMPYGNEAQSVINDLPDINTQGTVFIIEMGDDPSDDPMVVANDAEVGRQFIDVD